MKILMLKKNNMMKRENKFKKFVIQSFRKEWEKEEITMKRKIAILMMIFDV
jgi:isocitrate dehydrogenase